MASGQIIRKKMVNKIHTAVASAGSYKYLINLFSSLTRMHLGSKGFSENL
jgi:hypothetical protein